MKNSIFLMNSGLPTSENPADFLESMGSSIGGFRGRNIGNGYISYGFLKALYGEARLVPHISNAWEADLSDELLRSINENHSHLVFAAQDFIRESFQVLPFDKLNRFLEKVRIPIVPISLGANSFNGFDLTLANVLNTDQLRFLSILSEKSKSIGVRGEFTEALLLKLGIKNVRAIGCPSYFENGPERILVKRPWNPLGSITTGGFFNSQIPQSSHILQDELYFIDLLYLGNTLGSFTGTTSVEAMPYDIRDLPFSAEMLRKALNNQLEFFSSFQDWARFYADRQPCLTAGSRLHGGIFSTNHGAPAIVTNGDARARETCEYLGIPHFPGLDGNSDLRRIFEEIDFDKINSRYTIVYSRFIDYLREHDLTLDRISSQSIFKFPELRKNSSNETQTILHRDFQALAHEARSQLRTIPELVANIERLQAVQKENQQLMEFKNSLAGRIATKIKQTAHLSPKVTNLLKRLFQ